MRLTHRIMAVVALAALASRAHAQVSCADPDDLCTGDPCTITTTQVQCPCVVDFGNRTLVIAGVLDVPSACTLSFTAATVRLFGRIDGRHVGNGVGSGAQVELIATTGDADLRGEIDVTGTVAAGTIHVDAGGDIIVKDRLNAKPAGTNVTASGGSIELEADGTITTDQTAVIDAQGLDGDTVGGAVALRGAAGVLVKGRVIAEGSAGGTIEVSSDAGPVRLEKDLRVGSASGPAGSVSVSAGTGVVVADKIQAGADVAPGGSIVVTSATGDVSIEDDLNVRGPTSGIIDLSAPLGEVLLPLNLSVKGKNGGGSITVSALNLELRRNLTAESQLGIGGSVTLAATGLLHLNGADIKAKGAMGGGSIALLGGLASGDVTVERSSLLDARGTRGAGGTLVVSAPAGTVRFLTIRAMLAGYDPGGQVHMDAAALTVGPARIDAHGRTLPGVMRFSQSGTGTMLLSGTFEARRNGIIEGLAPAGNLTVIRSFRVGSGGCIGFSAGGTLDTSGASFDVPVTPSCP